MRILLFFSWFLIIQIGVASANDELPSWRRGAIKQDLTAFVRAIETPNQALFVPVAERIAVFDNDGTLWAEQPHYVPSLFVYDRIRARSKDHPEWIHELPFKYVLDRDQKKLTALSSDEYTQLLIASQENESIDAFEQQVMDWLSTHRHPEFNQSYIELVYQPMLEVLRYLRHHGFKTYIVSGGARDFMRPWTEAVYGIPPEQVIGTSLREIYEVKDGQPNIRSLSELDLMTNKQGKPVGIHAHLGRKPIIGFGNSDGDYEMLQWISSNPKPHRAYIIHHDDAEREWAYDRVSFIGQLNRALDDANRFNWHIVSMKNDWLCIFTKHPSSHAHR